MKSYNTTPPPARTPLYIDVELGWAHTIQDDEVVLTLGEDGEPLARRYRFPARATAQALIDGVKNLTPERAAALQAGGIEALVEMVGAVVGEEQVLTIAKDPTVSSDAFMAWLADMATAWGLTDALPDGPGN